MLTGVSPLVATTRSLGWGAVVIVELVVAASRVAIFLTIQPLVGAVPGVLVLREPPTVFTVAGGLAIAAGLCMTVRTER